MKITRNRYRGTATLSFGVDDKAFDEWLKEARKPGADLYESAEKVLKRRGGKVKETLAIQDEDEDLIP